MNIQKICIIGDGLAGLSTAIILSKENIQIDLYVGTKKTRNLKIDNRTTAISESSYKFLRERVKIKNIFYSCKEINLFYEDQKKILNFLNFEEKDKKLMYIFKNNNLKKILEKAISIKKNITLVKKKITHINYSDSSMLINKKKIFYDLIIVSTGSKSSINNEIANTRSIKKNYKEIAITAIVKHDSKINKAYQFFLKEGPLAILPTNKFFFSIVWSVNNFFFNKNKKLLKELLTNKIKILLNNTKINRIENIQSFSIQLDLKTKYFKKNILILGDGLHAIHPMAGQGFNLILRDIKKLSELISKNLKLGLIFKNSFLLEEFYQSRKPENNILGLGIDLTNIFFKNNKYFFPIKKVILNNLHRFGFIKKLSQSISDKGIST